MTTESTALPEKTTQELPVRAGFDTIQGYRALKSMALDLAASKLVPQTFQGNAPDCLIALEMAARIGASPLAVMQNMYIVHGKPGWSAQFVIACLNASGLFSPLRFEIEGDGDGRTCTAWAVERATGKTLEGPPVSIQMSKDEGWYGKNGSKWKTMPELMLRYRAATFFGRLYAPHILMGMQTMEEIVDIGPDGEIIGRELAANRPARDISAALDAAENQQDDSGPNVREEAEHRRQDTFAHIEQLGLSVDAVHADMRVSKAPASWGKAECAKAVEVAEAMAAEFQADAAREGQEG